MGWRERIQQIYDDNGEPLTLIAVVEQPTGLALRLDILNGSITPVTVDTDGKAFREFLEMANLKPNNSKVEALVNQESMLFRIPKGSRFESLSGETRIMAGQYLFVQKGAMVLDLQKKK